ncbi:MAG: hypothetical protein AcusKO_18380 [Acuticoccus sp.]
MAMGEEGLDFIALTPVEIRQRLWICVAFEEVGQPMGDYPHLAMLYAQRDWLAASDLHKAVDETFAGRTDVVTRIHSECILGDAFGSSMCDCGDQMHLAMDEMAKGEEGVFVYLRQEGRGIGLRSKLGCLALQYGYTDGQRGPRRYSSDEANLARGFAVDERHYETAARLLRALKIATVRLITGNPSKIADLKAAGVTVSDVVDVWHQGAPVSVRAMDEIKEKVARGYIYQR